MNIARSFAPFRLRLLPSIAGGILLALALPKFGVAGLAWAAPALILVSAMGAAGPAAFRLGFLGGLAHHLLSLSWLLNIPVMKLAPLAGWLALSGYLAIYQGAWVWACWRTFPAKPGALPLNHASDVSELLDRFLACGWAARLRWALGCAALWVGGEMIQARLFSGFPWNFLGSSQFEMLPIIQFASATGVYGISFLVAWFAVSLIAAVAVVLRRPESPRRCLGEVILPLAAVAGVVIVGYPQLFPPVTTSRTATLALIQPSIPQQMIWAPAESRQRFDQLLALSERALTNAPGTNRPTVLVWPEAAVPGYLRYDTNIYQAVTNLVQRHHIWLVLGADDAEPRRDPDDPFAHDSFNSSFLVAPDGEISATYRKRHLVMFGEYLPLSRWLPFLERLTGMGSFTPGTRAVPFILPGPGFKTSVLICFEDVFPHHVREDVEEDTDFLLNLTNNGWFGESAAQWQHAASAVFRAIENGVPLVRCANNGLTCVVSPNGRISHTFHPGTRDAYGPGYKIVEVPLLNGSRRMPTWYRQRGDVFGWSCVGWSALLVAAHLRQRVPKHSSS